MATGRTSFFRYLRIATVFHAILLAGVLLAPGCISLFSSKTDVPTNVDFMVEVNSAPRQNSGQGEAAVEKKANDVIDPNDIVRITPKPKPKPKPKPEQKNEAQTAKNKQKKLPEVRNEKKKLTREEIAKILAGDVQAVGNYHKSTLDDKKIRELLNQGATASDRTIIPEGDLLYYEIIKRAFNKAWSQPNYEEVGNSVTEIEVSFRVDGTISGVRLVKKSGKEVMDESVLHAAGTVQRVEGLPEEFLKKYQGKPIAIEFKVIPEG